MGEQGFWTRWAGRLSAGLLGAAGAHAGPVLQRVRAGGDVRAEAADVPLDTPMQLRSSSVDALQPVLAALQAVEAAL